MKARSVNIRGLSAKVRLANAFLGRTLKNRPFYFKNYLRFIPNGGRRRWFMRSTRCRIEGERSVWLVTVAPRQELIVAWA